MTADSPASGDRSRDPACIFCRIVAGEIPSTTVAEAYLRPGVARYLKSLQQRLTTRPTDRPDTIGVMTSSGGMRSIEEAHAAIGP